MQTQSAGEQRTLASIFCMQPAPTAAAQQASIARLSEAREEIMEEIEEKRERILELRKEIGDDEEALLNAEEDEIDLEPEGDVEVIFDAVAPMLEEDFNYTRYENEAEIRELEEEIAELEAKL